MRNSFIYIFFICQSEISTIVLHTKETPLHQNEILTKNRNENNNESNANILLYSKQLHEKVVQFPHFPQNL